MSDTRLRKLERQWRQTGSVEDEAAWLLELERCGVLPSSHIKIAAHLGHLATQQIHPDAIPEEDPSLDELDLRQWGRRLGRWNYQASVRAAIAATQRVIGYYQRAQPDDDRPLHALEAAVDWALCPCRRHQITANFRSNFSHCGPYNDRPHENLHIPIGHPRELSKAASAAALTAQAAGSTWGATLDFAQDATLCAVTSCVRNEEVRWAEARIIIVQEIRDNLIPWVLGRDDPILRANTQTVTP